MFIFNISFKKNKLKKILFFTVVLVVLILLFMCINTAIKKSQAVYVQDEVKQSNAINLTADNYANVLESSYSDIDNYVGKTIKFSGFVYRLYDFKDSQFVLGREMILSRISDTQAKVVVVGFLCETEKAKQFNDGTWVEIEGTIKKGFYHTNIPIIEVKSIKEVSEPEDPYVCPPDNTYVKTEII